MSSISLPFIKTSNTLNKKIWDSNEKINSEVRDKLLEISELFVETLKLDDIGLTVKDITVVGSLASYDYHQGSDMDVHVVLDYNEADVDKDFLDEYLNMKKKVFNDKYNFKIKGYEVELYAQDIAAENNFNGIYSIENNEWIKEPEQLEINVDKKEIIKQYKDIKKKLDKVSNREEYEKFKEFLKKYRKKGLETSIFSAENMVFKLMRKRGDLDRVSDKVTSDLEKELSLESLGLTL